MKFISALYKLTVWFQLYYLAHYDFLQIEYKAHCPSQVWYKCPTSYIQRNPHSRALSLATLKFFCWSNTFAELLWSTWVMWQTSADLWKFLHPLVNMFFFPAFVQSLQIIDKSSPEPLVCSHPNSFSHLSKNWLCLPPFSPFIVVTWPIKQRTNMGGSSFKFPGCVNRLQSPLCSSSQYGRHDVKSLSFVRKFFTSLKQQNLFNIQS